MATEPAATTPASLPSEADHVPPAPLEEAYIPPAPLEIEVSIQDIGGSESTRRQPQPSRPAIEDPAPEIELNPISPVKARPLADSDDQVELNPVEEPADPLQEDGDLEVPENEIPTIKLKI